MPQPTMAQLVLLELAARGRARRARARAGAVADRRRRRRRRARCCSRSCRGAALALPGRQSWPGWRRAGGAARARRRPGRTARRLRGRGGAGRRPGASIGVVRCGTTWSLPLVLGLDSVFNDDAAVPVHLLAELLHVEDVPLSSVRLFTLVTPPQRPARAPAGPARAADPAGRAVLPDHPRHPARGRRDGRPRRRAARPSHQILRRCAVHAEQVLATAGLTVRRLDEDAVASLFATWLGPAASTATGGAATKLASPGATCGWPAPGRRSSRSAARATTSLDRVARLAAVAPTPVVGTSLVLQPDRPRRRPRSRHAAGAAERARVRAARRRRSTRSRCWPDAFDLRLQPHRRRAGCAAARDHPVRRRGAGVRHGVPASRSRRPRRSRRRSSGVQVRAGPGRAGVAAAVPALGHARRGDVARAARATDRGAGGGGRHAGAGGHRPARSVGAAARPRPRRALDHRPTRCARSRAARRWSSTTGRSRRAARSRSRPGSAGIDVRARWAPTELGAFVHTDLAVFGAVGGRAHRP